MAKFSQIAKGSRARLRAISCTTLDGQSFLCDLGILDGAAEELAAGNAQKRAAEMSGDKSENDVNFQFAYAVEALLASALDPESPDDRPERFFESAEQIRANLDRERILFLAEMQRAFQEKVSPRVKSLSLEEYYQEVAGLISGSIDDHPFWGWPRTTQGTFLRTMAGQLANLDPPRSLGGMSSSDDSTKH